MELVEGKTLSSPLPIDTALNYARQIAEALEYAHERGVIHRDLKPANIKVTPEGVVKLLDFGLAKAIEDPAVPRDDPSNSPTLTLGATRVGVIMGTAAYMSPEQASGKRADRRADIWSFGAVFYEMLAGKKAFEGESVSDTLASVLKIEPRWDLLPAEAPASIRKLVRRCLTKEPRQRLQAIGEARIVLENPRAEEATAPSRLRLGMKATVAASVLAVIAAAAGFGWWRATRPVDHPLMKFGSELAQDPNGILRLDDTTLMYAQPGTFLALSPDGARLALQVRDADGRPRLATRQLDENRFTPLPGTENPTSPFFSPDGQWIAFFGDGKLRKIPVHGGAPVVLCSSGNFPSGSWGDDDNIIAALKRTFSALRVGTRWEAVRGHFIPRRDNGASEPVAFDIPAEFR